MNAHTAIAEQPPTDTWKFELGSWITHKDQSLPSLVMGRVRTTKGREVYGVRSFMNVDPNRDRMIGGDSLVAMAADHPDWNDCLLTPEMAAKLVG
jgi:hypothetical protein